jgi:hypothetical protein
VHHVIVYLHFAISRDISAEDMLLPSLSHSFLWLPSSFKQSQTVTLLPQLTRRKEANKRVVKIVFSFFMGYYNCIFSVNCGFIKFLSKNSKEIYLILFRLFKCLR